MDNSTTLPETGTCLEDAFSARPGPKDIECRIENYWTERSEGYKESVEEQIDSGAYSRWLDLISEHVDLGRPLRVLDVGTGPGFFPVILGRMGHRVTGVDLTEAMLDRARENCARYGVEADFAPMDAQDLSFPDGTFDLVVSRNLMWDLPDPRRAYSEWMRVLRRGGSLVVFDGNHYLYLNDPAYAATAPDYLKGHPDMHGVDPAEMENIARGLPLSSVRRPAWDTRVLTGLGARDVSTCGDGAVSDGGRRLPLNFAVFARR